MGKPVILLGAGASIDAGLPNTFQLTRLVYERMRAHSARHSEAALFGYVIAKLIARKVRAGGSPFDDVNIEEAYDAVLRLLSRSKDQMSDFVSSWDPNLADLSPGFDERAFSEHLVKAFADQSRSFTGSPVLSVNTNEMARAAHEISKGIRPQETSDAPVVVRAYLDSLVECLNVRHGSPQYLDGVARLAGEEGAIIGSLNYDLLIEEAAERLDIAMDYGLSRWNSERLVRWSGSGARFIKLHGSINWIGDYDNIEVGEHKPTYFSRSQPLLIFGGQSSKLNPEGPFLQLRNEFEKALLSTNKLLIVGYSFADLHMNALIRRWVSTRRKGQLIIVDPGVKLSGMELGRYFTHQRGSEIKYTVEIVNYRMPARQGIDIAIEALRRVPKMQELQIIHPNEAGSSDKAKRRRGRAKS